jgi:hypothetical protein
MKKYKVILSLDTTPQMKNTKLLCPLILQDDFPRGQMKKYKGIVSYLPRHHIAYEKIQIYSLPLHHNTNEKYKVIVVNQPDSYMKYPKYLEYKEIHLG